ncbi:hypothetical protein V9T40_003087 [Parthenolecanium corni]|uniref:Pyrroline-5-carboxylate reductase n=1 Tax=Parthenolecanium corni TaxID=536013 RepID=A0AAN9TS32_9HEMI
MARIGFLGAGKMAQAMANGFLNAGLVKADSLIASCAPLDKISSEAFEKFGSRVTFDNAEVVENSKVVILAVKPNTVPIVLDNIKQYVSKEHLLLSVAMGVTLQALEKGLENKCKVVRVMPNTPSLVQKGASVFVPGTSTTQNDIDLVIRLLQSLGTCDEVPEYLLDAITALSGSGPAYVYMIIEAMADGGVRMGLPRDLANKLASQTVLGAAEMVIQTKEHPGKLKDDVTSPAGSTAEGLHVLETSGIRGTIMKAVEMATRRCKETSAKTSEK